MGTLTSHMCIKHTFTRVAADCAAVEIKHDHGAGFRIRKNLLVTYLFITTVQFQRMVKIYTSYVYKNWIFFHICKRMGGGV